MQKPRFSDAANHYLTGKGYVQAAKLIVTHPDFEGAVVPATILSVNMLLGFAMELYLKAWLMDVGETKNLRGTIRHNLKGLRDLGRVNDLPEVPGLDVLVDFLHPRHLDHSNRYMKQGDYEQVNFALAEQIFALMDLAWIARLRLPTPGNVQHVDD